MLEIELCVICNEPTGRAGKADDSIYVTLLYRFYAWIKCDDIGPLCTACRDALGQLGLIESEE